LLKVIPSAGIDFAELETVNFGAIRHLMPNAQAQPPTARLAG